MEWLGRRLIALTRDRELLILDTMANNNEVYSIDVGSHASSISVLPNTKNIVVAYPDGIKIIEIGSTNQ